MPRELPHVVPGIAYLGGFLHADWTAPRQLKKDYITTMGTCGDCPGRRGSGNTPSALAPNQQRGSMSPIGCRRARLPGASSAPAGASTTPAACPSAAPSSFRTGPSLIDGQGPAFQRLAVEASDRRVGSRLGWHLHESEAAGLARELVLENSDGGDLPKGLKGFAQILFGYIAREISYKNVHGEPSFMPCTDLS